MIGYCSGGRHTSPYVTNDTNVWNMVANGLEGTPDRQFLRTVGSPG